MSVEEGADLELVTSLLNHADDDVRIQAMESLVASLHVDEARAVAVKCIPSIARCVPPPPDETCLPLFGHDVALAALAALEAIDSAYQGRCVLQPHLGTIQTTLDDADPAVRQAARRIMDAHPVPPHLTAAHTPR